MFVLFVLVDGYGFGVDRCCFVWDLWLFSCLCGVFCSGVLLDFACAVALIVL